MEGAWAVIGLMLGLSAALIPVMLGPIPAIAPAPGDMPVMEGLMPVFTYDMFMVLAVMFAAVLIPDMLMYVFMEFIPSPVFMLPTEV